MKSWRIIAVSLLCLALAGSIACNPFGGAEEEISQQLVEVERGDLIISVSGSGNIDVANEAELTFDIGGKVDRIYVKEGDKVSKGDMLAKLDTTSLELAIKNAESSLKASEIDLETATDSYRKITYPYTFHTYAFDVPESIGFIKDAQYELDSVYKLLDELGPNREQYSWEQYYDMRDAIKKAQDKLIEARNKLARGSGTDVFGTEFLPMRDFWTLRAAELAMEKAQLGLENAQLALGEANDNLEKVWIHAPFDGIVASVYAEEGDIVPSPTLSARVIIHLIDLTTMELEVEVDEIDIAEVKPGQRAIIEVDALPDLQLEGKVTSISLLAREEAGLVLYDVKIGFNVPQVSGLRVGMSATADIVIDERSNVLLVPDRAIKQDSQGNPVVEVMVGEQIEERPVVTGISDGFQTEIVDGLREGDTVVIEIRVKPEPSGMGLF